jgi:F-type H+-transporting ATPase subunit delta
MARFRALPYAKALFQVVRSQAPSRTEEIGEELGRVAATLEAVPELQRLLVTPTVPVEKKAATLEQVLDVLEVGEPTRRFVHVVFRHYRTQHMADIATAYQQLVDQAMGRCRAQVETATALDSRQQMRLLQVVSEAVGTSVTADFSTNAELLAGFRVRVGSRVFDGSLVGELDRLSKEIEIE